MSFTDDQIASLRAAIATGALTVRNANGETVTYRSLAEMREILAIMERQAGPGATHINPVFDRGL